MITSSENTTVELEKPDFEKAFFFLPKQTNWVCDCEKRVPITIDGNTTALSNYQVKLQIPDLPEINSDFSNVMFTSSDETTQIDHWVQASNSSDGTAWVEIPSIPAVGTTIYMYYGDCGSSGNPENVFDYYNDFTSSAGVSNLRNGSFRTETFMGESVLRKHTHCDPSGAQIPLGFNIDDFILITKDARPRDGSDRGCGWNRYGLENANFDGYSIRRQGNSGRDFGVERRDNGRGGNASLRNMNPTIPLDTFVITELRRCCANNQNQGVIYNTSGEQLEIVNHSIASHNYCNFDRIAIRGGREYIIDYMAVAKNSCNPPVASFGIPVADGPEAICSNPVVAIGASGTMIIDSSVIDNNSDDNCDMVLNASISKSTFSCADLGLDMTVLTVTDDQGNTASCISTVTIVDTLSPILSCANDTILYADPGVCLETNVSLTAPISMDNCSIATIDNDLPSGDTLSVGNHTITWSISDQSGNVSTCIQTVTVRDTVAPFISCPDSLIVAAGIGMCDTVGLSLTGLVVGDECGVMSTANNAPNTYPKGVTTVTWTATDVNGNVSHCDQVIRVTDNEPPRIVCGDTIKLAANMDCASPVVQLVQPAAMDNCDIDSVVSNAPIPPMSFMIGLDTIVWEVRDDNGNIGTCNQIVKVTDQVDPILTCPDTLKVNTNAGSCVATSGVLPLPTIKENCAINTTTNNAGASFPLGISTFMWTVTDDAGNTGTCTQIVSVADNVAPMITCPPDITIYSTANTCESQVASLGMAIASDNCPDSTVTNNALLTVYPVGGTSVVWTITDKAGSTNSCTQVITVRDTVGPSITCQDTIVTTADFSGCVSTNVNLESPLTSDACGIDTFFNNASTPYNLGFSNVTWTVRDANGNVNTCNTVINVLDVEAPLLACPPDTSVSCGHSTNPSLLGFPVATDLCSMPLTNSRIDSITSRSLILPEKYTLERYWQVRDNAGNLAECIQTIIVCPESIPTIEDWSLIYLLIIMLIIGVVSIKSTKPNAVKIDES